MEIIVGGDIIDASKYISREIINILAKKYNFDANDAIKYLDVNTIRCEHNSDVSSSKQKVNIPLPFCGNINKNCCHGIRLNYGLYTQCTNEITIYNKEYPVCQTCNKQIEKNSNNQPTYGFITSRLEQGISYRDPKGKMPTNYANVMQKMNITREDAEIAAKKLGLIIPEDQFVIKKAQRGRPKKDTSADDTASESSYLELKTEKKRGRPKKTKDVVNIDDIGNKMLQDLIKTNEQNVETNEQNVEANNSISNSDNESDGAEAIPIKLTKKSEVGYIIVENESNADYLLTADNELYAPFTHDHKGVWNAAMKRIEFVDSDSD